LTCSDGLRHAGGGRLAGWAWALVMTMKVSSRHLRTTN
jgi:hypothetical protein